MGFDRLFEKLRISLDLMTLLYKLQVLHDDKVAKMLLTSDAVNEWPDEEDMNLLTTQGEEGAVEIHFLPKGRRPPGKDVEQAGRRYDDWEPVYIGSVAGEVPTLKSQPVKPGKFAEAVLSRVFPKVGPIAARGEFRSNNGGKGISGVSAAYSLVVPIDDLKKVPRWVLKRDVLPWKIRLEFETKPLLGKARKHKFSATVKHAHIKDFVTGPIYNRREIPCLVLEYGTKYKDLEVRKSNTREGCSFTDIKMTLDAFDARDIELFSSRVTSKLRLKPSMRMAQATGEEIRKWYDVENTRKDYPTNRPAFASCMSHPEKAEFLDLYCKNPGQVSLLTMRDEDGMLVGRALVWKLSHHPTGKQFFMDRVYAGQPTIPQTFAAYAAERGWETNPNTAMEVRLDRWDFKHWPFVDTMCYLDDKTGRMINEAMRTEHRLAARRGGDQAAEGSWWMLRTGHGARVR